MIKVTVFDNINVIRSLVKNADESVRIAWAQENEKSCGYCVFRENGELLDIVDKDAVSELLLRAALNYLDLRDVAVASCEKKELKSFLSKLGFFEDNGVMKVNIRSFFKPCCSENKK